MRANFDSEEWAESKSKNSIRKSYGGKVIEENFATEGFSGHSVSVFDATKKIWKQTWVDDSGAYLLFEGGMVGKEFILKQTNTQPGVAMRMVFKEITESSFDWSWEASKDGEKTWKPMWVVAYKRAKS